jgi:hypothetical protein
VLQPPLKKNDKCIKKYNYWIFSVSQTENTQTQKKKKNKKKKKKNKYKFLFSLAQWLAFQGCPFRCHDKNLDSKNRDNFLEMIQILASYNEKVASIVLKMLQNLQSILHI